MATLLEELDGLVSALNDNKIEYAVCGGLALTIHGFPRATFDIDILIRAESLEKAYEIAAKKGYDIRGFDMSFKEKAVEIRRISKIDDDGEVLSLDLLLVTPKVEDVWETKETLIWQNRSLWIVSLEGLIKMKTLAGRAKDLNDIDRIENEES
ncbi:MAG: nucleotidyltransferase family protein [Acidobacteriota bacterium]|nr:nucleotidyltransferase family protein [Acidobacteriota bacterium]